MPTSRILTSGTYIQRFWAEESEKASDEAKALAKKQNCHQGEGGRE